LLIQDIPIVVVGNKVDVVREIELGDIQDWAQHFLPQERYKKDTVATDELLCLKNAGTYISMFFT
jgi:hypothetical protein